ncbi:hypothetical protein JD844_024435 [Phrynosoma platyrhinos]|uniref:Triadin-like n=1 Tax=Phrynosoma platyrhinos TaxID=52577 RepID=A0ABQ7SYQ5_PHRPL|nr:hypothetical protein JD844_024435 [Phrynosoma platyrhinos]
MPRSVVESPPVHEKKEDKPLKAVEHEKQKAKETKHVKENEAKHETAKKDKEHVKEKEAKHEATKKDKDALKEKVKPPPPVKAREAAKPKEVQPPILQKQKAPKLIKETKDASHRAAAGQDAVRHDKETPPRKPAKSKGTTKPSDEKTVTGKTVEKAHCKEEKAKTPEVKETHHHHNVTADKISKAAKTTKGYSEISTAKKSAVRYYQCVFVNGYNGYTSEYSVTPAKDYKGKTGQSKASGHKTKTPKQ